MSRGRVVPVSRGVGHRAGHEDTQALLHRHRFWDLQFVPWILLQGPWGGHRGSAATSAPHPGAGPRPRTLGLCPTHLPTAGAEAAAASPGSPALGLFLDYLASGPACLAWKEAPTGSFWRRWGWGPSTEEEPQEPQMSQKSLIFGLLLSQRKVTRQRENAGSPGAILRGRVVPGMGSWELLE